MNSNTGTQANIFCPTDSHSCM